MSVSRLRALAPALLLAVAAAAAPVREARAEEPRPTDARTARARASLRADRASIASSAREVRGLLRAARRSGSQTQVSCVDESLSRCDASVRAARELEARAALALDRGDVAEGERLARRLHELAAAAKQARGSARACSPQAAAVAEGTTVTLTIEL